MFPAWGIAGMANLTAGAAGAGSLFRGANRAVQARSRSDPLVDQTTHDPTHSLLLPRAGFAALRPSPAIRSQTRGRVRDSPQRPIRPRSSVVRAGNRLVAHPTNAPHEHTATTHRHDTRARHEIGRASGASGIVLRPASQNHSMLQPVPARRRTRDSYVASGTRIAFVHGLGVRRFTRRRRAAPLRVVP